MSDVDGHSGEGVLTAIRTQHILTYGLSRSPTRANFQNIPKRLHRIRELLVISFPPLLRLDIECLPILVPVHDPGHYRMSIRAGANKQEDHQEQRPKVEEGRLSKSVSVMLSS